jgi:hypothetical protein
LRFRIGFPYKGSRSIVPDPDERGLLVDLDVEDFSLHWCSVTNEIGVQQLGPGGPVGEQRPLNGGLGRFEFSRGKAGAIREPGVMPSREVAAIPGVRKPIPPPRAYAGAQPKSAAIIAVVNTSRIIVSIRAN